MPRLQTLRQHQWRFVLVSGAIAIVAAAAIVWEEYAAAREGHLREIRVVNDLTATRLEQTLALTRERMQGLVEDPLIRQMEPGPCSAVLEEARRVLPEYTNLFVVRADGVPLCRGISREGPAFPGSAADRPWFAAATAPGAGFTASLPIFGVVSQEWVIVLTLPIEGVGASPGGILAVSIPIDSYLTLLYRGDLPAGYRVTVSDAEGRVVLRSHDVLDHIDPDAETLPRAENSERIFEVRRGLSRGPSAEGPMYEWAFRHLDGADWVVYTGVPVSAIVTASSTAALPKLAFIFLLFAVPAVLGGRLLQRVRRSMDDLLHWSRAEESRNEDGAEPVLPRPDVALAEIQELADSFDRALEERAVALGSARRARDRVSSILENAVLGIYVSDPNGFVADANRAMALMLGYESAEELMGLRVEAFYRDPQDRARVLEAANADPRSSAESMWRRRDGRTFPVRLSWHRVEVEGAVGFEVIAEDLSERRNLEDQLRQAQKLEAVGRLAGGVAHDFNNRLTVITGQAEILLDELRAGAPEREYVRSILESAKRSAELTAQLLAFSRRQVVRPRVLDLNEAIRAVKGIADRLLGDDIEVIERLTATATVFADPGQMEQILMNLCTNARDALPEGGRITLSTERRVLSEEEAAAQVEADAGEYVVLGVSDTGQGMDEATRSRIFEPFFTTKAPGKGTGLGLATVYGIVSQAGGHLRVFSWPGRGTTFEIWLPWCAAELVGVEQEPETMPLPVSTGETILVVEDEVQVRTVVVRTLERAGFNVLATEDGYSALELTAALGRPVDLLVSDVLMPGIKGPELAARLADEGRIERVLFLSGYSDAGPEPGVDGLPWDFLQKPFAASRLMEKIQALLDRPAYSGAGTLPLSS